MGARIPPNDRPRRGGIKCEFCGRAVPSIQALRSHQISLHSTALKEKNKQKSVPVKSSKVQKPEPRKLLVKKVKTTPELKSNNSSVQTKIKPKTDKEKVKLKPKPDKVKDNLEKPKSKVAREYAVSTKMDSTSSTNAKHRRTEFKCPKCDKYFTMMFLAQKHIQKKHSVNGNDESGSPDSPDEMQPIPMELCLYCNDKFETPHDCPNKPTSGVATSYICTGCQQRFQNSKLFDVHVANVHGERSENMFFPNEDEFNSWKETMENQTQCNYTLMGQYSAKQVFRCSNSSDNSTNDEAVFCPSMVVKTEFPKGYQVNFYLSHYGHDFKEYELTDQYKSYSITDLLEQGGCDVSNMGSDENDLYLQFKTLMENIVFDAAKINIDMLKILVGKALDMTSILTQYDEDEEIISTVSSTFSLHTRNTKEDQLTKTLEGLRSSQRKRSVLENGKGEKRFKSDKKYSLADDKDTDKILQELEGNKRRRIESPSNDMENIRSPIQSPSFNDTYKDFIVKNAQKHVQNKLPEGRTSTPFKKRNVVKTKIGQFRPSISPKKRTSFGKGRDLEYEVREREDECNILVLKI